MDNQERDRIERAVRQRAYDDGYDDGRLDIAREYEQRIADLRKANDQLSVCLGETHLEIGRLTALFSESTTAEMSFEGRLVPINSAGMRELVDLAVARQSEVDRLTLLVAEMTSQADEIADEAYDEGWAAGKQAEFESAREAREWLDS